MAWLKMAGWLAWALLATVARFSCRAVKIAWEKTRWIRVVALIVVYGHGLGLLSWTIYGSAIVIAWWHADWVYAVGASVGVGKLTTPIWLVGMTWESNRQWPAIGRFINAMMAFMGRHNAIFLWMAGVIAFVGWVTWICY